MQNRKCPNNVRPRFAVAGATGRIGLDLLAALSGDPVDVVALTRRPEATLPPGVTSAHVDFDRPATLESALEAVDRLFIVQGTSPKQAANEIALLDAAVAAGVGHVVKVSVLGPATRLYPFAWHMEVEAHLARLPIASTVLRPSVFASTLLRSGTQIAAGSWAGAAANGRVNFMDTSDVAVVGRLALLEDVDPVSQRAYHLTGTRSWTMPQVADELTRLLGRPVEYVNRTPDEHRAALLASGIAPFVADILVGLEQMYRESAIGETTQTFAELTGREPRSLTDFLSDNIAAFQSAGEEG